jgi:hypothetical protein
MRQEVVLALLAKEPSHGFQLQARLREALGPFGTQLNPGQVYARDPLGRNGPNHQRAIRQSRLASKAPRSGGSRRWRHQRLGPKLLAQSESDPDSCSGRGSDS